MSSGLGVAGLPGDLLARVLDRCRSLAGETAAILATGSYAAGRATPSSDLDLSVLRPTGPEMPYHTWFEPRPDALPLHVSVDFDTLAGWRAHSAEPARWSLGLPTATPVQVLWSVPGLDLELGDPPALRHPPGSPELEDFLEGAVKTRRALAAGDLAGARWHARSFAELLPSLLVPLNPERRVRDRRDLLDAILSFPNAPPNYAADLAVCLGLTAADDAVFVAAARRLPEITLAWLRFNAPDVDDSPWLGRYLADGTLEAHLRGAG